MNKLKELLTGHSKGDSGSGDYSNDNFDEQKYREEKYGSSTGHGEAPYANPGSYDNKESVVADRSNTSGYDASADTPATTGSRSAESYEPMTSAINDNSYAATGPTDYSSTGRGTGTVTEEYRTGGIDRSTYDAPQTSRNTETIDTAPTTTTYEAPATTAYTTTTTTTEPISSAIYTIPTQGVGEVLPGRANLSSEISQNDPQYQQVLEDMKRHGIADEDTPVGTGQMRYAGQDMTGTSTQDYSTSTTGGDYSSGRGESLTQRTEERIDPSYSTGSGYDNTSSRRDVDTENYGNSSAISRGSGANATGASRGETTLDESSRGGYGNTSSGYGSSSTGRDNTSSGYDNSSSTGNEHLNASDEAARVRAQYEKNADTYAPSADQGPNAGTTANRETGSSGRKAGREPEGSQDDQDQSSSHGQGQSSSGYGQGQTSSYGQGGVASYGQAQYIPVITSSSGNYGSTQSQGQGLSHAIGGDYGGSSTSGQESMTQRFEDKYDQSGSSNQQSSGMMGKAEQEFDQYKDSMTSSEKKYPR